MTQYNIVEFFLLLELGLVVLIAILTYALKLFFLLRKYYRQNLAISLQAYFNAPSYKILQNIKNFPHKFKKLYLLLANIKENDSKNTNNHWADIRALILSHTLLPLARKATFKRRWIDRFYATEAFQLLTEAGDEKYILTLVNDKVPLVYLNALSAALSYGSADAINRVITKMATERRLTKTIYLQAFETAPQTTCSIIMDRLKIGHEPYVREACYEILMKYSSATLDWDIQADLYSNKLELKLASMRFLAHVEKKSAIDRLLNFLNDPQWQAREVALKCLGELEAYEAIPQIANCLHDPKWWVRLHAALSLKKLGPQGVEILKSQNPQIDRFAFEVAQYVLATSPQK